MRRLVPAILLTAMAASGCANGRSAPVVTSAASAAPQGSAVALGQSVVAGNLVLTPVEVVEDSRCAAGTQCIWSGRVVVRIRAEGDGWNRIVDLVAGEDMTIEGHSVLLPSVKPARVAEGEIAAGDYRFTFSAR